jgi:hypothetical protein
LTDLSYNFLEAKKLKEVLSPRFNEKLKTFDKSVPELVGLKKETKYIDNYFEFSQRDQSVTGEDT